jgi:hypothetical protein
MGRVGHGRGEAAPRLKTKSAHRPRSTPLAARPGRQRHRVVPCRRAPGSDRQIARSGAAITAIFAARYSRPR